MRRNQLMVAAIGVGLLAGLAGCGEESISSSPPRSDGAEPRSNLGGDGLPVQNPGEGYGHQPVALTGVMALEDDGCWTIDLGDGARLVVFPAGYTKPHDDTSEAVMRGPDGTTVSSGMAVDARGGVVPAAGFPGVPDGYWGNYLAFCDPEKREFAVLDAVEPAFDPGALDQAGHTAMVRDATLSEAWGCGIGFAASTEDQHVALVIHLRDASGVVAPPVGLPDYRWTAEIVIGKLLMAGWCNDAVESWAPVPIVVARWPLVDGTLVFTPPEDSGCAAGSPVIATLRGAVAAAPGGGIAVADLSLVNEAYGCFAG